MAPFPHSLGQFLKVSFREMQAGKSMEDIQKRFQRLEEAALILTTPIEPGGEAFLPSVLTTLDTIIQAIEKQQRSLAALHEGLTEPAVVRAIQKAVRET